jgi:hypothetical protein
MWPSTDELVRILGAGVNVVTTAAFIDGRRLGPDRKRLVDACERGRSSLFGTGISPGWAELRPFGVDVLSLVLVTTDTPALRRLLADKGRPAPSRMASPARVAEIGLARLHQGPVYSWGPLAGLRATGSRARVRLVTTLSRKILGDDRSQRSWS